MYDSSLFHNVGRSVNKALDNAFDNCDEHSYDESSAGSLVTVDDSAFAKVKSGILNGLMNACNYQTVVDTPTR